MRLLVIAPHLAPDTAPTGVVVSALVAEMTAVGHQVHVVTSLPWYEKHAIDPDWKSKGWRQQGEFAGATVTRCYPFPAAGRQKQFAGPGFRFYRFHRTGYLDLGIYPKAFRRRIGCFAAPNFGLGRLDSGPPSPLPTDF